MWWETKAICKKLSILLDDKFHKFSFGKIRFLISFHLLNLWAFVVSFLNGGSAILDDRCGSNSVDFGYYYLSLDGPDGHCLDGFKILERLCQLGAHFALFNLHLEQVHLVGTQ